MKQLKGLISFSLLLAFSACESDHLEVYEEPITSMFLVLIPENGGTRVVLSYLDKDGPGGNPPIVNSGTLKTGSIYHAEVILQQQSVASPRLAHVIDTTSVMNQPETHQVFFNPLGDLQIETEYLDKDNNGNPVGFQSEFYTGLETKGQLQVLIIHEPNKLGQFVDIGMSDHAGGTIDLEAIFEITVE